MLSNTRTGARRFQADQDGINQLKNDFFNEARDFVYFRKGEWTGAVESMANAAQWVAAHPEYLPVAIAMYPPTRALLADVTRLSGKSAKWIKERFFGDRDAKCITRRVVACDGSITKSQLREWEKACGKGSVALIEPSQVGAFRYIVNERRYAFFSRFGKDDLRGITGSDDVIIRWLRDMFDTEFMTARIAAECRLGAGDGRGLSRAGGSRTRSALMRSSR